MIVATASANPKENILKNFASAFPNADSVVWQQGDTEMSVYFINAGMKCRIWYDVDGNILRCIRYCRQDKLPPMVIASLQKNYPAMKISGITEFSSAEKFVYEIVLENEKKFFIVSADVTGNLSLTRKFNKAPVENSTQK